MEGKFFDDIYIDAKPIAPPPSISIIQVKGVRRDAFEAYMKVLYQS